MCCALRDAKRLRRVKENLLAKVQSSLDSGATILQTAEFDGTGRRMGKVITSSGDYDGTVVYFYGGQKNIREHGSTFELCSEP